MVSLSCGISKSMSPASEVLPEDRSLEGWEGVRGSGPLRVLFDLSDVADALKGRASFGVTTVPRLRRLDVRRR